MSKTPKRFTLTATVDLPSGHFEQADKLSAIKTLVEGFEEQWSRIGGTVDHIVIQVRQRGNGAPGSATQSSEDVYSEVSEGTA